ncbi:MAG: class I SAM-dependent methyltransferase [Rubripirellula sp.]
MWSERYNEKPAWNQRLDVVVKAIIGSYPGSFQDKQLLDFGCGTGDVAKALAHLGGQVLAIDASEQMITKGNTTNSDPKISFRQFQVKSDPNQLRDQLLAEDHALFDAAVSSSVMEYVPDPLVALQTIHSVLNENGHLWFTVPSDDTPRRKIESVIKATRLHHPLKLVLGLSKVGRLMHHLSYSNNRFSAARWIELCQQAGFSQAKQLQVDGLQHLWLIHAIR